MDRLDLGSPFQMVASWCGGWISNPLYSHANILLLCLLHIKSIKYNKISDSKSDVKIFNGRTIAGAASLVLVVLAWLWLLTILYITQAVSLWLDKHL